jgi:TolB-like protein/Flp pilus assembly protein TadD
VPPLSSSQAIIRFGDFSVDPRSGELCKRGTRIKLQIQPFQVLHVLLERAGEVVTREELQKKIWPADTFVDFDHGLNKAINKLREALGDSAESPRFIETLSRRGYRFIAHVEELVNRARTAAMPAATVTVDSIAVLPFINMSADPENEFFTDGITEEIINALAQIKELHVVARSSAFSFKGKHVDPRSIGEQLNVRTVLEGSVRRVDSRLRFTVQLINAADGYHLWSERYDREMKDVFEIQDEIARSIAERLKVTLEGAQEPLVKVGTTNLEAYQLYVKGRILLPRRGSPVPRAVECFQQAVTLDPEYAQAWAGLADAYTVLGYSGFARPEACMPKGMEAARRAVALAPSLAEAHNALACACLLGSWDKAEAEGEFLRALELNPRYGQARNWYALFYLQWTVGSLEESVAQAKLALKLDPLSSYAHTVVGFTCSGAGRHAEAVQACERAVELDRESYLACWCLHLSLRACGRFEEAVAVGESSLGMSGRHTWAVMSLAETFAEWNKPADAEALYAELVARSRRSYIQPSMLSASAAAAGMEEEAIYHACEAVRVRDPVLPLAFSKYWSHTARLRAYPRFLDILASAGME